MPEILVITLLFCNRKENRIMGNRKLVTDPKAALPVRKYQKDKPWSCRYCYWWKKGGCKEEQCRYLVTKEKKKDIPHEPGNCKGCPYGQHFPCIGYCIAALYRELGATDKEVKACRKK